MEYGVLSQGAMKYTLNLQEIRLEFMSKSKSPDVCSRSLTLPRQELMMISIQVHVFYSPMLSTAPVFQSSIMPLACHLEIWFWTRFVQRFQALFGIKKTKRRNSQIHPWTIASGSNSSLNFQKVQFSPWTISIGPVSSLCRAGVDTV